VVAAIVRTNRDFAASFTALDFSSTMRECAGGLAVCEDKGDGANVLYSRLCCTPDGRGVCTYAELLLL
jgi:hypothetical protein